MSEVQAAQRVVVRCRSPRCLSSLRLPAGRHGMVACPVCKRRFWATTEQETVLIRALRTVLHNQEGIALCSAVLMLLALVWLSLLYSLRQEVEFGIIWGLCGAVLSWWGLHLILKRPDLENILIGCLKEIRTFFAVVTVSFGIIAAISLWRFGTSDPLASTHTLLELERLRNEYEHGVLMPFLRSPGWKFAFAAIALLSFGIQLRALRRAVYGLATQLPKMARIMLFVMIAFSAFTFGGALSDGAIGRVLPVLATQETQIIEGFQAETARDMPVIIDALADAIMQSQSMAQQGAAAPSVTKLAVSAMPLDRASPDSIEGRRDDSASDAPRDPELPDGPDGGEGGPRRPKGPSQPNNLISAWNDAFHRDALTSRDRINAAASSLSTSAVVSDGYSPPDDTTLRQVDTFSKRPISMRPARSESPADEDIRSVLVAGLSLLEKAGRPEDVFEEHVANADPFSRQLQEMTNTLAFDPLKNAVKDLIAAVLVESLKDPRIDPRAWLRSKLQGVDARSPLYSLRRAVQSLRTAISGTIAELLSPLPLPKPNFDTACNTIDKEYEWLWQSRAIIFDDRLYEVLRKEEPRFQSGVTRRGKIERAVLETRLIAAFSYGAPTSSRSLALENFERAILGTAEVEAGLRKERAAQAMRLQPNLDYLFKTHSHPPVESSSTTAASVSDASTNSQQTGEPLWNANEFIAGVRGSWVVTENPKWPGKLFVHLAERDGTLLDLLYSVQVERDGSWTVFTPSPSAPEGTLGVRQGSLARPTGVTIGTCNCR